MNGVTYTLADDKLTIVIDVSKAAIDRAPPSQSGKTYLVASTGAAVALETKHARELRMQVNITAKKL